MFTEVQIINLGLSKIASSRISRIDPPVSALERHCANGYSHWKWTELTKRRWVFATEDNYALAQTDYIDGVDQPYKYQLPPSCLRPIRQKYTEWKQRGKYIFSSYSDLKISFVEKVLETDFDPLFVEVLACRVALETVEFATQSNTKKADTKTLYDEAVAAAGKVNAFIIGPEDVVSNDNTFPFLTSRF